MLIVKDIINNIVSHVRPEREPSKFTRNFFYCDHLHCDITIYIVILYFSEIDSLEREALNVFKAHTKQLDRLGTAVEELTIAYLNHSSQNQQFLSKFIGILASIHAQFDTIQNM